MTKLFLLFLLLLPAFALANDAGIIAFNAPSTLLKNQEIAVNFLVSSDNNVSFKVFLFDGANLLNSKDYNILAGNFLSDLNLKLGTTGLHTLTFQISQISFIDGNTDSNALNNQANFYIQVKDYPDLQPLSITPSPMPITPNASITITSTIANLSLYDADNYEIRLYLDANLLESRTTNFSSLQTYTFQHIWIVPSNFQGIHNLRLTINENNTKPESNYANNSLDLAISNIQEAELLIPINDINFLSVPTLNESFAIYFKVKNIGGKQANNFTVKVYQTLQAESRIIYQTVINAIQPNSSQTLQFNFIPKVEGADKFIFKVDSENVVIEGDKTNNITEKSFNVGKTQETAIVGYTHTIQLYKSCFFVMNNGDIIVVEDFNSGMVKINISQQNGTVYEDVNTGRKFDGYFGTGDELHAFGLTMKLIAVHENDATLMLVYTYSNPIRNSSCEMDLKQCNSKLGEQTRALENCQGVLWKWSVDFEKVNQDYNYCSSKVNVAEASRSECQNNLNFANVLLTQNDEKCRKDKDTSTASQTAGFDAVKLELNKQIVKITTDLKREKSLTNSLLVVIILIAIGILCFIGFKDKLLGGNH